MVSSPSPPCSGVVDDEELEIKLEVRDTCVLWERDHQRLASYCALLETWGTPVDRVGGCPERVPLASVASPVGDVSRC